MSAVLDAGAVFELLARRGHEGPVREAMERAAFDVRAPELMDLEVTSSVRRLLHRGVIPHEVAMVTIDALRIAPVERVGHAALLSRVWELRDRLTPYDATYLALAERPEPGREPSTLVTTDARLGRTVRAIGTVDVVVVAVP